MEGERMRRLSVLGLMLAVALAALVLGLAARLGNEAVFYCVAPVVGAVLATRAAPRDRWAGLKGGLAGGLVQGVVGPLILQRGYPFPDVAMLTGGLFLQALAIHLGLGLIFGLLLVAIAGSRPGPTGAAESTPGGKTP